MKGHDLGNARRSDHVISDTGAGYGGSPSYHNGVFEDNVTTNTNTGYANLFTASVENNIGAPTYVGKEENITHVGKEENFAYGNTGYTGPFTGSLGHIGTTPYVGNEENFAYENTEYANPLAASLGHNAGVATYATNGWNPTSTAAQTMNDIVGSGPIPGIGSGMPALSPNAGVYHPVGPQAPWGPVRFPCTHPNCSRTFGRPSDLARHAKKHEANPVMYPCPVARCSFTGSKSSLRHDKLLSHARKAHGLEL